MAHKSPSCGSKIPSLWLKNPLQTAVREYAMEMSNVGQYLATSRELLENNLDLAKDALEFAKLKETAEKCKGGHCEECTVYQECDKKKM